MTGSDPKRKKPRQRPVGSKEFFDAVDEHLKDVETAEQTASGFADLQRSYSIIETLLHVSASINSTLNLKELLRKTLDAVIRITDCNRGYLMLREGDGTLALAMARSKDGEDLAREDAILSRTVIERVASTREPLFISDVQQEDILRKQNSIVELNINAVIGIPLVFEDNLVGVIYADSDHISARFSASDLSIMNAFGAQAAVAIENARRLGELESIRSSLEKQNTTLREALAEKYEFSGMIGRSPEMQQIFEIIRKVAPFSTTVLIEGETGTGKELIAKAIHYNSPRKHQAIVSVNCGALPKDILESELYGYAKGAFTGADQNRAGLFEAAHGGTLFLDEIGEMAMELQVKLLRSLQEGEVRRLGEETARSVNVRVISATNKDLAKEVERGAFRKDLYYRLNVVPIHIPPLRDRQPDILPLADFFLKKFSDEMNKPKPLLTRAAKELLLSNTWTGNVRELENAIERALALGEGKQMLDVDQFGQLVTAKSASTLSEGEGALKSMLVFWEKDFIRKMLIRHSWNISKTASMLQISRQQLHNKIRKYGLSPDL